MEREKYYTPQIEEFCVGFECEVNWNKGYEDNFVPLIIDVKDKNGAYTNTLQEVIRAYDDGYAEFRVKYLDQEDIKSLDWIVTKNRDYEFDAQYLKRDTIFFEILFEIEDNRLIIEKFTQMYPNTYNSSTIFEGKIKNKSELKKLMRMLEI